MEKEKKILIKYIIYILVGLFIVIYGMFHKMPITFADTYNINYLDDQVYYDNNGSSVTAVGQTWNESMQAYISNNITTASGSYGAGVSFNTAIPILANHTYTLTLAFEQNNANLSLSSKNRVSIGTSSSSASYNYANSNFYATMVQSQIVNNKIIQIVFTATGGGSYIFVPWTTTSTVTQRYVFTSYQIDDLGSSGVSESTINNSLNNQTNIINNSINSSTNNIISNSDSNRQAIIDNQNANNQALLDQNKENFNTCRDSYNLFNKSTIVMGDVTNQNNTIRASSRQSLYLDVGTYTFKTNLDLSIYGISLQITSSAPPLNNYNYIRDFGYIGNQTYTFNVSTAGYFVMQIRKNGNLTFNLNDISSNKYMLAKGSSISDFEDFGEEICVNKLDEGEKTRKGILGKLTDFFNNMFSNDDADVSGLNNMVGWLPAGPVDSIINLPLSLFNSLMNTITGTCSPVLLNLPFVNKSLTLPCFAAFMGQYLTGFSTLWTLIGTILSVFILYRYLLSLYKWIDDTLTLRENNLPGYYDDNWGGGA